MRSFFRIARRAAPWSLLLLTPLASGNVTASDYNDFPDASLEPSADIADFYAWETDKGTIVAVLTFGSYAVNAGAPSWDAGPGGPHDVGRLAGALRVTRAAHVRFSPIR